MIFSIHNFLTKKTFTSFTNIDFFMRKYTRFDVLQTQRSKIFLKNFLKKAKFFKKYPIVIVSDDKSTIKQINKFLKASKYDLKHISLNSANTVCVINGWRPGAISSCLHKKIITGASLLIVLGNGQWANDCITEGYRARIPTFYTTPTSSQGLFLFQKHNQTIKLAALALTILTAIFFPERRNRTSTSGFSGLRSTIELPR